MEIEELLAPVEFDETVADFSGSLDYIDSLNTDPAFSIRGRDIGIIANTLPDSEFEPGVLPHGSVKDNREWRPNGNFDPGELIPGSAKITQRIATPELPYSPREIERIIRSPSYRKTHRQIFKTKRQLSTNIGFNLPDYLGICIKRKIRREIMHTFGYAGRFFRPKYRNFYSMVPC